MSNLIGKEVYVEVRKSSYGYSSDMEWKKGTIVAEFTGGDVLVEYGVDRTREATENVAFVDVVEGGGAER